MNLSSLSSSVNSIKSSGVTALSSIASTTYSIVTNEKEKCDICSLDVSKGQATIGLITLERCTLCLKKCCGKCITKNKELLPDKVKEALGKDSLEWVCVNCEPIITQLYMKAFKQTFCDELDNKVHSFFEQNEIPLLLYKQPGPVEDSLSRQFYRFAQVVEVVAKVTGLVYLKYAYQAAKYAFMGKELYQILISGDFLAVLGPVSNFIVYLNQYF